MRIWSVHPSELDRIGLVACWRETLLAQAVLADETKGYRNHPQLKRFREAANPMELVGAYLKGILNEAAARGYKFNGDKILHPIAPNQQIEVTEEQLEYEWKHLGNKLEQRSPELFKVWKEKAPTAHPLFAVVPGPIAEWERV